MIKSGKRQNDKEVKKKAEKEMAKRQGGKQEWKWGKCEEGKRLFVHSVGFEPTSTNTFELESNPLDRSGTNADTPPTSSLNESPAYVPHTNTT